jgi:hypothetical protein
MVEESMDIGGARTMWVAFVVENDEADYPVEIGVLGAIALVAKVNRVTDLVQEAG